jgi:hypothetical protein
MEPPVAHFVEGVFEIVSECGELVKAEHGPGALDGVQSAEGSSHKFVVAPIVVKRQERGLQFDEDLASFFQERLLEFVDRRLF